MIKPIRIGLFGYGVVGAGFARLVAQIPGAEISRIVVKHPFLHQELGPELLAGHLHEVLYDKDIDVIVEAIDDADAAFTILRLALEQGKPVITANKRMVANHLPEIIRLQRRFRTPVLYEAACCAGIPVIRTLEDYFRPELVGGLTGIINGSTNYILTAMERFRFRFDHALQLAQEAGFAESDAALDVEGTDAACKLSIIVRHLWGLYVPPERILHTGIQHVLPQDLRLAEQLGGVVKLVAQTQKLDTGKVTAFILPRLVLKGTPLYQVLQEYNGIVLEDIYGDEQLLYGKGSGAAPTAQGLWADLQAWRRGYRYQYPEKELLTLSYDKELTLHFSLPNGAYVPPQLQQQLEYYAADSRYQYFTGRLSLQALASGSWWREKGISILDISAIAGDEEALKEQLNTLMLLRTDIFQPV
ncbi:homoserine dehydrogenase [Taibaiella koreensis]|uniref:homoserine dehydrogenase n=1 Tax=Taibaiella koreensis TaxID=1268548 RepID=UPI000E59BEB0|nr:homoserine dehydrogenase [Taibaiella koreensis]